ncbi:hypothetical protein K7B10_21315 [Streptomyces flavotricini]|uniref:Uncharacterized protein n=1 Tax=Streptomyces flavotricini TaxID=66888 RepID=A0ABS8E7Z7_9ACTN|nr:hypothetical protein [Streptomyces flavotricini]MCC0097280.1 hypothetical protein [Streptomyces flavotricini]
MSRARGVWWLLAAVIAVLVGCGVSAAALPAPGSVSAPVPGAVSASAGGSGAASAAASATGPAAAADLAPVRAVASADRGPACDPGTRDHGQAPGVPPRGAGEHAHAPVARPAVEQAWADRTAPVRVLVRGPDQPAPGPVELSVMRV